MNREKGKKIGRSKTSYQLYENNFKNYIMNITLQNTNFSNTYIRIYKLI